jgi:hypothetical protein
MRQAVLPRLLSGGLPALPAGELSRERRRAKGAWRPPWRALA